jgi:hypothetical protein
MPRKSNVSVSAVSPEESASFRAAAKEDGLSIEVCWVIIYLLARLVTCRRKGKGKECRSADIGIIGPESP